MNEFNIGEIIVDEEIYIGDIEIDVIKLTPELEDLEVIPSTEEQNFKSTKYGFDEVTVKRVNLQDKEIILNKNGIYNITADKDYLGLNNVEVTLEAIGGLIPKVEGNTLILSGAKVEGGVLTI